jgi:hypothetical protein
MGNDIETNQTEETTTRAGHIRDVAMLDLRYAKTAEDLAAIKSISDVGLVLIPEHLGGVLAGIAIRDVGGIVPIPQDRKVNCLTGQITLSGESLAAGDPETVLIVAGQAFITGEVTTVGYAELRILGQIFAPRSGQAAITAKLTQMSGQCLYLPPNPRIMLGDRRASYEFLDLLPEPTSLVVMGELTFESDVTKEILRAKIIEIVLMGSIRAPKELLPLLDVLTVERMGEITAVE